MPFINNLKIFCLICVSLNATSISFADNNDFSAGELANLLNGQSISCMVKAGAASGNATWIFTSLENNKLKGKLDFHGTPGCSSDDLNGKLKKNRLQFFGSVNPNMCWGSISGYLEFFKGSDGNLKAEGLFKTSGSAKGPIKC